MFRTYTARIFTCAMMAGIALGVGPMASAATISAGFDLFATVNTPTFPTYVTLGVGGPTVALQGVPIGTLDGVYLGNTDTIVERTGSTQTIGIGGTATFNLQLRALDLMSTAPVNGALIGLPPGTYNLQVIGGDLIGGPTSPVVTNGITITETSSTGGTFSSRLAVTCALIFRQVGNPGNMFTQSDSLMFTPTAIPTWSTSGIPDDAHGGMFVAGGFYAGTDPGNSAPFSEEAAAMMTMHSVMPGSVPEPASFVLLGIGMLSIGAFGWRHRKHSI
jgi:PEP-CTERM motif